MSFDNHKLSISHLLLAIFVTLIWGFNISFAKIALDNFEPFTALMLGFMMAAAILLPLYPKPPIKISQIILISAIFSIGNMGCMFWALKMGLDSSVGIMVQQIQIPFLIILSVFFLKEKIRLKVITGILVSITGIFLLMGSPNSLNNLPAFFIMILSGLFWSIYSIKIKKAGNTKALALIAWISLFSTILLLPFSLIFENNQINNFKSASPIHIITLIYSGIAPSIIGHGLWKYLLSHNPSSSVAPILLLVPLFGVLSGVIFLNEILSKEMIIGGSFILTGIAIIVLRRPKLIKKI